VSERLCKVTWPDPESSRKDSEGTTQCPTLMSCPADQTFPTVIRRLWTSSSPTSCWRVPKRRGAELLGCDGLLSQVTRAVLERALGEELTGHLGYDKLVGTVLVKGL
jgi:hypothetical protein